MVNHPARHPRSRQSPLGHSQTKTRHPRQATILLSFSRLALAFSIALIFGLTNHASADLLVYRPPGTNMVVQLMGKVDVNVGGTISYRHPRGTLHFSRHDCQIVRTASKRKLFGVERLAAKRSGTADAYLSLALWCVEHAMIKEADQALSDAWKIDPENKKVKMMVALTRYRRGTVPSSPSIENEMRAFVKNDDMKVERSRHFILLHDTPEEDDPILGMPTAKYRLQLLEKVYDSYFMKYALEGYPLRVPREPMRVVLFNDHGDYLNFVKLLDPSLKNAAGFYAPKENIAIYYQQRSSDTFEGLGDISKMLSDLRQDLKRAKIRGEVRGVGEVIRFAKTLELLIDIMVEDQEIEVVTHEATHQLAANSELLSREKFQVRWAHEGLASYFEAPKDATWSGIGAVNETRLNYYRILSQDPEHSGIEFVVTDKIFDYAGTHFSQLAAYGQAWALTHFLMERHLAKLIEFYRKMAVDDFETRRDDAWRAKVLATFEDCFGDLDKLELEWRKYMRQLRTDTEKLADQL